MNIATLRTQLQSVNLPELARLSQVGVRTIRRLKNDEHWSCNMKTVEKLIEALPKVRK